MGSLPFAEWMEKQEPFEEPEHPKRPRYAVDWDDTCVEEYREDGSRYWPNSGPWKHGAVGALWLLATKGKTVVYSMRTHLLEYDHETRRAYSDVREQFDLIRAMLDAAGLTEIEVYDTRWGKPPAEFYVDDKGVHFKTWNQTLMEIEEREAE